MNKNRIIYYNTLLLLYSSPDNNIIALVHNIVSPVKNNVLLYSVYMNINIKDIILSNMNILCIMISKSFICI